MYNGTGRLAQSFPSAFVVLSHFVSLIKVSCIRFCRNLWEAWISGSRRGVAEHKIIGGSITVGNNLERMSIILKQEALAGYKAAKLGFSNSGLGVAVLCQERQYSRVKKGKLPKKQMSVGDH